MILATTLLHVPGREELALLDVDHAPGLGRRDQKVGLPAEEGRDLQHVDDLGDFGALRRLVHVGEHRQPELRRGARRRRQRCVEPEPRARLRRSCGSPCRRRSCRRARSRAGRAISFSAPAMSKACARLSIWHGPAISASGSALPKRTEPTATIVSGRGTLVICDMNGALAVNRAITVTSRAQPAEAINQFTSARCFSLRFFSQA